MSRYLAMYNLIGDFGSSEFSAKECKEEFEFKENTSLYGNGQELWSNFIIINGSIKERPPIKYDIRYDRRYEKKKEKNFLIVFLEDLYEKSLEYIADIKIIKINIERKQ